MAGPPGTTSRGGGDAPDRRPGSGARNGPGETREPRAPGERRGSGARRGPGEPDQHGGPDAARARLVDELRDSGRLTSPAVEAAFRAVPRHVFLPEMAATEAYQDEAFVIKTGDDGMPVSSSSQPAIMAIMLEQLGLAPGHRVLEIGTGTGYNAALMAFLVGERGSVVTVDIDVDLVARARANLAAAGYADVVVLCGDGGFGAPDRAPFDRVIVTAGAWDLAPAWLAQLGPGGRIVLPLSVRGIQLCVALEREAGHWRSRSACRCGFIRMAGAFAGPESFVPLGPQPGLHVQADEGRPLDADALYAVLSGPATDVPAGVQVVGLGELGEADLWLTVTEPDLIRLTITGGGPVRDALLPLLPFGAMADPGTVSDAGGAGDLGVVALLPVRLPSARRRYGEFEVAVRGFGPPGAGLARYLAGRVLAWDELGRPGASGLRLTVYPPGTPEEALPGQVILDRRHTRLALSWPAP
jgi:protein-L-isoaspartate(D-aspartate) O-methyltransferase